MARRMVAIELLAGDGILTGETTDKRITVHYSLEVLQEVIDSRSGAEITGAIEVRGTVKPAPELTLERLLLRLEDGRVLRCTVTGSDGTVQSIGGFSHGSHWN